MDWNKVQELNQRVMLDAGGAFTVALCYIGDRLGLFRAMADGRPVTSDELARRTNLNERYVREWLKGLVAAEYVEYRGESNHYFLTPEQAAVLADENSLAFACGAFQLAIPLMLRVPRLMEVFRKGGGLSYDELGHEIAEGVDRLHRPAFTYLLAQQWLPAVPGLKERLEAGASVLDVGCGLGRSSVAMGLAYSRSAVVGLDPDLYSVERARSLAREHKAENVEFLCSPLERLRQRDFDLILAIDCVHDMADPAGALQWIRGALKGDGLFLWVEPTGSRDPVENRNPAGKMRSTLSPLFCLTVSLAEGGAGLGTIIGEAGARELAQQAGFSVFQRVPIDNPLQQFFLLQP